LVGVNVRCLGKYSVAEQFGLYDGSGPWCPQHPTGGNWSEKSTRRRSKRRSDCVSRRYDELATLNAPRRRRMQTLDAPRQTLENAPRR
jgi:hypothetical protein